MLIKIIEETGIRHEGYGHLKKGEIREVEDHHALFFIKNGWAESQDGSVLVGERGSLDFENPDEFDTQAADGEDTPPKSAKKTAPKPGAKPSKKGTIQPDDVEIKTRG